MRQVPIFLALNCVRDKGSRAHQTWSLEEQSPKDWLLVLVLTSQTIGKGALDVS